MKCEIAYNDVDVSWSVRVTIQELQKLAGRAYF